MEHTNYAARLRYLDANQVSDAAIDYNGLTVVGPDNAKLGDLDGFIVDADAGRVYYAVIDTGGWFTTKQLLLPIGHATLDASGRALRADLTRDALGRYPEFDSSRFQQFSDDELRQFEARMGAACCPDDAVATPAGRWAYDTRRHYTQPSWWRPTMRSDGRPAAVTGAAAAAHAAAERRDIDVPPTRRDREFETERRDRDLVTAHGVDESGRRDPGEVSPHFAGRAQPGDVLGIETGGERTHIGEDADDENKRRRDAERATRPGKE